MRADEILDTAEFVAGLAICDGRELSIRLTEREDLKALSGYIDRLPAPLRYNRFLGAVSQLPRSDVDVIAHQGRGGRFAMVATVRLHGEDVIVGEARLAIDDASRRGELGLSVAEPWQRCGIGTALLTYLECRASHLGAIGLFGDTLRTNQTMLALARRAGYALTPVSGDWKLVRFGRSLTREDWHLPCPHLASAAMPRVEVRP
jgi:GNAT superfamily N-acetyltransferase